MNDIISNPEIWLGIVALNMTVIGLTSLAEKRLVIGVEYGKYLIDKFRLYNVVRLYHLMVVFAIVNALSLVFMCGMFSPYFARSSSCCSLSAHGG
jgi:hypothetical protein